MYEELVAFLLGKKDEFTDDDLDKFIDLLNNALEITEEYDIHKKQFIIENMVDRTEVTDKEERAVITSAIDNILQLDEGDEEVDLFEDKSDDDAPLRTRKFTRGAKGDRATKEGDAGSVRSSSTRNSKTPASEVRSLGGREPAAPEEGSLPSKKVRIDRAEEKGDGREQSSFVEQEDLLKSDFKTPEKKKPQVRFSELFASNKKFDGDVTKPQNGDFPDGGSRARQAASDKGNVSEEFKFEIGELEENHNEGPDFVFNTENSE